MPTVVIADTTPGLKPALEAIFAPHGGVGGVISKNGGTVYIKPGLVKVDQASAHDWFHFCSAPP